MTEYKARPESWQEDAARWLDAILELRSRVEALEAKYETQRLATLEWGKDVDKVKRWSDQNLRRIEALEANSQPTPNDRQIRSSLVERVALAISRCEDSSAWDDEAVNWAPEARAAIREVAAWMTSNPNVYFPPALVFALEQEAER